MIISTLDMRCRYIAAPGTRTESLSPFGDHLKSLGISIPKDCSLDHMVDAGWIQPVLRVALSRAALESWENYPELSMRGTDKCPIKEQWCLSLWNNALTGPILPSANTPNWWTHFLDDDSNPLTKVIRSHAIDPTDKNARPGFFNHPYRGERILPWIDFFAYWQAYQLAELLAAVTAKFCLTPGFETRVVAQPTRQLEFVELNARRIHKRWEKRRSTFEWLSRLRTLFAAGIDRDQDKIAEAVKLIARQSRLSAVRLSAKIRNTLLVIWQDWNGRENTLPGYDKIRQSLRQDIEYALWIRQILSGQRPDFLAQYWTYPDRSLRPWAQLIDALPKDIEVARKRFSELALMYLDEHVKVAPPQFLIDANTINGLLSKFWDKCRPLRRFCLALYRMHQEVSDRGGAFGEKMIPSNEVIEQLITTILNAERVLVFFQRTRNPTATGRYQETPRAVKNQLNVVLGKFNLTKRAVGVNAMAATGRLIKQKAGLASLRDTDGTRRHLVQRIWSFLQSIKPSVIYVRRRAQKNAAILIDTKSDLYDLAQRRGQIFVTPAEVKSGSDQADYFAAAHVNFLIARNYAAHHDSLDQDLVIPNDLDPSKHPGRVALQSILTVVITCLQTSP